MSQDMLTEINQDFKTISECLQRIVLNINKLLSLLAEYKKEHDEIWSEVGGPT